MVTASEYQIRAAAFEERKKRFDEWLCRVRELARLEGREAAFKECCLGKKGRLYIETYGEEQATD